MTSVANALLKGADSAVRKSPGAALVRVICSRWLWFFLIAAPTIAFCTRRMPANPVEPLVLCGVERLVPLGERATLRVATFNIHSGVGHDRHQDLRRIARCIEQLDLVAMQEVRGDLLGFNGIQAHVVGDATSMASLFMPNEWSCYQNPIGNALLTRIPLLMQQRIPLASNNDHGYRGALLAQFLFQGRTVNLLSTHIDRGKDHELQIKAVVDLYLALAEPSILMGDLNSEGSHPQLQRLLGAPGVQNALKDFGRSGKRNAPIDWIVTRGFRTIDAAWIEESGSDHPLVRAELSLLNGK